MYKTPSGIDNLRSHIDIFTLSSLFYLKASNHAFIHEKKKLITHFGFFSVSNENELEMQVHDPESREQYIISTIYTSLNLKYQCLW